MRVTHITNPNSYESILKEGAIKPCATLGFGCPSSDGILDNEFVFFGFNSDKYRSLISPYYFEFNAEYLITEYDGRVGIDMVLDYDRIIEEVVGETLLKIPWTEEPNLTKRHLRIQLEAELTDPVGLTKRAGDMLDIINERVDKARSEKRKAGQEALDWIKSLDPEGDEYYNLEIVVDKSVPIAKAISHGKLKPKEEK